MNTSQASSNQLKSALKKPSPMRGGKAPTKPAISSSSSEESGTSSSSSPSPSPEKEFQPQTGAFSTHAEKDFCFDDMVKKAQKDMEKMMGGKSVGVFKAVETTRPQVLTGPPPKGTILKKNLNNHHNVTTNKDVVRRDGTVKNNHVTNKDVVRRDGTVKNNHVTTNKDVVRRDGAVKNNHVTNKDVIRRDGAVTERESQRWEDSPAPGIRRHHHVVSESTQLKGHDGATVGNQTRRQQESEASGGHEEILPDGTKRKVFTKSYETRQVFTSSSSHPKAL